MTDLRACIKCAGNRVILFDHGYSSFNVGGGRCDNCEYEVAKGGLGCFPTQKELAEIWNAGNIPCANCGERIDRLTDPLGNKTDRWIHINRTGDETTFICPGPGSIQYREATPVKLPEHKHRIVVCAVVLRDGKAVMQLRAPHKAYGANTWFFPGGKSEWQESVPECTARELKEELGITVDPKKVFVWQMREVIREGAHDIMAYVIVREFEGEPTNLDTKNTTRIEWFDIAGTNWTDTIHEPQDIWYEVGQAIEGLQWLDAQCERQGHQ